MEAKKKAGIKKAIREATAPELAGILGLTFVALVGAHGRLVSVAEASRATGMSRGWFYDRAGEPWMRRLGRIYRVDLVALVTPAFELCLAAFAERR